MKGRWPSTSTLALAAYCVLCALVIQSVQAQQASTSGAPADVFHLAIPAQPLGTALSALGRATELSVLVGSDLLDGRTSAPVEGDYPAREALQRLLTGTGLEATFISAHSAVLLASPQASSSPSPFPSSPSSNLAPLPDPDPDSAPPVAGANAAGNDYMSYAAAIQARLTEALCGQPQTRPGSFRLLLQFRIDGAGRIVSPRLLESTGTPAQDSAISHAIDGLSLDSAPPAALPQPVTILFRLRNLGSDCASLDGPGE